VVYFFHRPEVIINAYRLFLLFFASVIIHGAADAQSLRGTDMRTALPESLLVNRRDWGVDFNLGGACLRGNSDMDYLDTSFSSFRKSENATAYIKGSLLYSDFNGARNINQGALTLRYDHDIGEAGDWRLFGFTTNAYNEFQLLDYRLVLGAGPWYDFTLGPTKHGASIAVTHEVEDFANGAYDHSTRMSLRDFIALPLSPSSELTADLFWAPRFDNFSNYRMFAEVALHSMIYKDLIGLKLSWNSEYYTSPQPGVDRTDTLWSTAVTLRLGK